MSKKTETLLATGYRSFALWTSLSIVVIIFDQATKAMIVRWVDLYEKIPINSFINITYQRNTGAAFSFLADESGWQRWFFIVVATTVSGYIVSWLWKIREEGLAVLSVGLSLVLGGAIGNVIDRIVWGSVVDFIQVLIAGWPFPSFNIADSAITVGAALLIIDALFVSGKEDTFKRKAKKKVAKRKTKKKVRKKAAKKKAAKRKTKKKATKRKAKKKVTKKKTTKVPPGA